MRREQVACRAETAIVGTRISGTPTDPLPPALPATVFQPFKRVIQDVATPGGNPVPAGHQALISVPAGSSPMYLQFSGRSKAMQNAGPVGEDAVNADAAPWVRNTQFSRVLVTLTGGAADGFAFEHEARGGLYLPPGVGARVDLVGLSGARRLDLGGFLDADAGAQNISADEISAAAWPTSPDRAPRGRYTVRLSDVFFFDPGDDFGPFFVFSQGCQRYRATYQLMPNLEDPLGNFEFREVVFATTSVTRRLYAQCWSMETTGWRSAANLVGLEVRGDGLSGTVGLVTIEQELWL